MNVFLLDPSERLLSAFIWVSASNTIGLYTLPDWDKNEYVFIDTGIECVSRFLLRMYWSLTFLPGDILELVLHPIPRSYCYPLRRK